MKIRKLELKNYRIFDDVKFDFTDVDGTTLDTVVLAGVNGTGKTTILDLINDIFSGNRIKNITKNFEIKIELDFSGTNLLKLLSSKMSFPDADFFVFDEYTASDFVSKFSISNNVLTIYYQHKNAKTKTVTDFTKLAENINEAIKNSYENIKGVYRYSNDKIKSDPPKKSNPPKKKVSGFFQEVSFHTHQGDMKKRVLDPITEQFFSNLDIPRREIIENKIRGLNQIFKNIDINTKLTNISKDELLFTSKNGQEIKFEDLSSGEKQISFAGIYFATLDIANSVVLIDEPEDSMHPSWQNKILDFYKNIGKNTQLIVATHSPQIIASAKPENVFLLKFEENKVVIKQPKYSKGHSIPYVLSEIMETSYRDSYINNIVNQYLTLIRKGEHETNEGKKLFEIINTLSPESEERVDVDFSLRRFNAIGK